MVKFSRIIEAAIEWTATVLFRPFNPKKWFILSFAALMAGFLAGGSFNFSSHNYERNENKHSCSLRNSNILFSSADSRQSDASAFFKDFIEQMLKIKKSVLIPIIGIAVFVLLGFFVLMSWLSSRFAFIFLEDVVKNDASIRPPFRENKELGESLFSFTLVFTLIILALFAGFIFMLLNCLGRLGVFNKVITAGFKQIFWTVLPFALIFIFLILIAAVVSLVVRHFITVIMFRDRIRIMQAWPKFFSILTSHKQDFVVYLFIAMGLGIFTSLASFLLYLSAFFGLLFPAGILTLAFYLLHLIIPQAFQLSYFIIIAVVFSPAALFVLYSLLCLNLPFAVFFRTLSVKFIAALDQHYNLFRYKESG